jgi:hydroxymethylpyrimidine pyrophosphatase-like HAD family hydrolase
MSNNGWIGCDLDGTLAVYNGWVGPEHIGEPIPRMVARIKEHLANGYTVKIMTARVCDGLESTRKAIEDWTERHLGQRLEVTNQKDYDMLFLYDDRCFQVEINTGRIIGYDEEHPN